MSRKVKSMRGEEVDFDLFDIKNKILQAPKNESIKQRERFIDKKRRKGSKKRVDELLHQKKVNEKVSATVEPVMDQVIDEAKPETVDQQAASPQKRKIIKNETKAD